MYIFRLLIVSLVVLSGADASAQILTEQDAIERCMRTNTTVVTSRIALQSDSLGVESVRSGWLPQVRTDLRASFIPLDSSSRQVVLSRPAPAIDTTYLTGTNAAGSGLDGSVSLTQNLPGGGTLQGSAALSRTAALSGDAGERAAGLSLNLRQPLLRNAWEFGSQGWAVQLARLDHQQFTLSQQRTILSTITQVRQAWWESYEKHKLCGLFQAQQDYFEKLLTTERARFEVGQVSALDTLSAAYAFLQSRQQLHAASISAVLAANALATLLGTTAGEVVIDTALVAHPDSLDMDAEQFLRRAEQFNPELKIFETLQARLQAQVRRDNNQLLPDVALQGSLQRSTSGERPGSGSGSYASSAVLALVASYELPTVPRRITRSQHNLSLESSHLEQQQHRRELTRKVEELLFTWQKDREALELAHAAAQVARRQFDVAQASYEVGAVDRLNLLKAENDYLSSTVTLLQRQLALQRVAIVLDELTGTVFDRFAIRLAP